MMIEYAAGNEHSPMERDGRVTLGLDLDGTVNVRHYAWLTHEVVSWSARVDPAIPRDIVAAVRAAGIPGQTGKPIVPDTHLRTLRVDGLGFVILAGDLARIPGPYATVFAQLHELAAAIMAGPPDATAAPEPPPARR